MAKDRLRVRRLTLVPAAQPENDETTTESVAFLEEDCFLATEHLDRVSMVAQAATSRSGPHVHGLEDVKGSRFWALDSASETSDDESVVSLDTPEFVKHAQEVGFTISQLLSAEKELDYPIAEQPKEGTKAKRIVDAKVRHQQERRPWRGPLPAPRVSPLRTFGDAIVSAKVCHKASSLPHCNTKNRVPPPLFSSPAQPSPEPGLLQPSRSTSCGELGRNTGLTTTEISEDVSNFKPDKKLGSSSRKGPKRMWLSPSVPYRPTAGLVTFFSP
jgi:hypothetical protein